MMRKTGLFAATLLCLAAAGPAFATGGLNCAIDDENLTAAFDAGFNYSIPGPMFGIKGEIKPKQAGLPAELVPVVLDDKSLAQQWLDGDDLRLEFYRETANGDFAMVDLKIMTKRDPEDETSYTGEYDLGMQLPGANADGTANIIHKTGKVSCSVG